MKTGLVSGKITPHFAAVYVPVRRGRVCGFGWADSRRHAPEERLNEAFTRVQEQLQRTPEG